MNTKTKNLKNMIYQEILGGIIRGEYKANQILNEQELVTRFGVSKSPVREALIILCSEGVLRSIPRCGYEVIQLSHAEVQEILDFRFVLESGLLRTCFADITDGQLQKLEEIDTLCRTSAEDVWVHWEHNVSFHLTLLSFSGNSYAYDQLRRSMDILKRVYAQAYWGKWNAACNPGDVRYHRNIIEHIRNREIDKAVECLRLDLFDFRIS